MQPCVSQQWWCSASPTAAQLECINVFTTFTCSCWLKVLNLDVCFEKNKNNNNKISCFIQQRAKIPVTHSAVLRLSRHLFQLFPSSSVLVVQLTSSVFRLPACLDQFTSLSPWKQQHICQESVCFFLIKFHVYLAKNLCCCQNPQSPLSWDEHKCIDEFASSTCPLKLSGKHWLIQISSQASMPSRMGNHKHIKNGFDGVYWLLRFES